MPYLHFMVVSAGRTLMKEGDLPTCVYFVVSGEVEMSRKLMNKVMLYIHIYTYSYIYIYISYSYFIRQITRKVESKPEAFFGPGDWIGEIELLEEDSRMNTYKATSKSFEKYRMLLNCCL